MHLEALVRAALQRALYALQLPCPAKIPVGRPTRPEHGDLSSRVAFVLGRAAGKPPQALARDIAEHLSKEQAFASVTSEGGFVNVTLAPEALSDVVRRALRDSDRYGCGDEGQGRPLQVEFVSSNPTGPLTVGHGRQAALGDVVACLLAQQGWNVTREYYLNDEGGQIRRLAHSLWARYRQAQGGDVPIPEGGYEGDYLICVAEELAEHLGDRYRAWSEETAQLFAQHAVQRMMDIIQEDLRAVGVAFDVWSREGDLHRRGLVTETLEALRAREAVYEHDGAQWLRATAHGLTRDPVLIKSDGTPTYIMVDIAYHLDKLRRGFHRVINVQGADHVDTQRQVRLGLKLLGVSDAFLDYCIHQFVTVKGAEGVQRMSTRTGRFLRLSELVSELGRDVFRYFMVMRKPSSHLNFDYALATSTSMENPVYYVQYAHTRICSIQREAHRHGVMPEDLTAVDLAPLEDPSERAMILEIDRFPDVLAAAADAYAPHLVCEFLESLSGMFHPYYGRIRVLGQGSATPARLALLAATGLVLRRGLSVLGLSTPEEM